MKFLVELCCFAAGLTLAAADYRADVVVYGGTSGGVIAAAAAAREKAAVILIEETGHLGGMTSSGLGHVDIARPETLGGMTLEYFQSVRAKYRPNTPLFRVTPAKAEQAFDELAARYPNLTVLKKQRLKELLRDAAVRENGRIKTLKLESGDTVSGKVFIDATYEGDLLAAAAVSSRLGREGAAEYGESAAGAGNPVELSYAKATDAAGNLLPDLIRSGHLKPGAADELTQSFNFRFCMTTDPANRKPFAKPADYNPAWYENTLNYLLARPDKEWKFNDIISYWFFLPEGNKVDVNNRGINSTDVINLSHGWAEASYAERAKLWQLHRDHNQGLFYFLANDPRVPESMRRDAARWGLAADEFTDHGNWPYRLYIREGRRLVGDYVMTQRDAFETNLKDDSIGLGSYMLDVHWVRKYATPDGKVFAEGLLGIGRPALPVRPYEIPYRALLPKAAECVNLLAPVPLSASHVIYSSLRMEPVFMTAGEAAGIAAALAAAGDRPVQQIDVAQLQRKLLAFGGVLHYPGGNRLFPRTEELPGLVRDDRQAKKSGRWNHAEGGTPMLDGGYAYSDFGSGATAEYTFDAVEAGSYRLALLTPRNHRTSLKVTARGEGFSREFAVALGEAAAAPETVLGELAIAAPGQVTVTIAPLTAKDAAVADGVLLLKLDDTK